METPDKMSSSNILSMFFTPEQQTLICKSCYATFHPRFNPPMKLYCCSQFICENCAPKVSKANACPYKNGGSCNSKEFKGCRKLKKNFKMTQANMMTLIKDRILIARIPPKVTE